MKIHQRKKANTTKYNKNKKNKNTKTQKEINKYNKEATK